MSTVEDPFELLVTDNEAGGTPPVRPESLVPPLAVSTPPGAATARLHGFGLDEQPLVTGVPGLSGEIVSARATVPLRHGHVGSAVVVLLDRGDPRRPIVVGVLQDPGRSSHHPTDHPADLITVQVDDDRLVLSAEREIVLRCGDASITLTRAGKVLIKGTYVLSRSSGSNKIKGAAVEIN
jgi:Domain of unknown function (DUF6484)